jgi:DnaJ-class molecular chaperone
VSIAVDPSKDYYKALGVSSTASSDEIKKAYRKLAKQCHPDSTGGDKAKEARFKEISSAYDVLGDAKKRAEYDELRALGAGRASGFASGFAGASAHSRGGPSSFGDMGVWDLGDLFAQFGNVSGGATSGGRGGAGSRVRVEHFAEGFGSAGAERRGRAEAADADFESTVRASDGSWLKVSSSSPGDVSSDVRISFERAILGTVASVPTIDGRAEVKIPPGTSSGKRLRLRGKGRSENGRQGDHYITIHIDVPSDLDDEAQNLLVQLATQLRKRGRDE